MGISWSCRLRQVPIQTPLTFLFRSGVAVGAGLVRALLPERLSQSTEAGLQRGVVAQADRDRARVGVAVVYVVQVNEPTTLARDFSEEQLDHAELTRESAPGALVVSCPFHAVTVTTQTGCRGPRHGTGRTASASSPRCHPRLDCATSRGGHESPSELRSARTSPRGAGDGSGGAPPGHESAWEVSDLRETWQLMQRRSRMGPG